MVRISLSCYYYYYYGRTFFLKILPNSSRPEPTARIAVWGGFIIAENSLIPNIPRFEILQH